MRFRVAVSVAVKSTTRLQTWGWIVRICELVSLVFQPRQNQILGYRARVQFAKMLSSVSIQLTLLSRESVTDRFTVTGSRGASRA